MTVFHLLLGRPWKFDRGFIHNGRTNHYIFKMKGKEYVLRHMSPIQVITNKQATHRGDNSERATHQKESERHKPKSSASTMSEKKNLVIFSTKSEIRGLCENPSSVLHCVLMCKDNAPQNKTSHTLPLVLSSLLQEFQDVFPMSYLRVYLLYEALSTESTSSPEHLFRTKLHTASTPKKPKKYKGK